MKMTRWFSFLLAMLLCLCVLPAHAETVEVVEVPAEYFTLEEEWYTDEELLDGYALRELYGFGDSSVFGVSGRDTLQPLTQKLYDVLAAEIKKIAAGERSSTKIDITPEQLAALGFTTEAASCEALSTQLEAELDETLDMFRALMLDHPYDLYWFDYTSPHQLRQVRRCCRSHRCWQLYRHH